jgi:hypothetical protein
VTLATPHDLRADLAASKPLWFELYHRAFIGQEFGELLSCPFETDEGLQARGVDRYLNFDSGEHHPADDKAEKWNLGNLCLEVWSNWGRRFPGWIKGQNETRWLGFAAMPFHLAWVVEYAPLCQLYEERKFEWRRLDYPRIEKRNYDRIYRYWYTTVSVLVPRSEVVAAGVRCLESSW